MGLRLDAFSLAIVAISGIPIMLAITEEFANSLVEREPDIFFDI